MIDMPYLRFAAAALAGALLSVPVATVPSDAQGLRGGGGGMGMGRGGFSGGGMSAGRGGFGGSAINAGRGGFGGGSAGAVGNPGARPPGGHWHGGHRHHAWHPGHHRHHHHHGRWRGGRWPVYGYGLGLGYGAYPYDGHYDQAAYAEPQPEAEDPAVAACAKRFRSYDPQSRTYGGKGGRRIACP